MMKMENGEREKIRGREKKRLKKEFKKGGTGKRRICEERGKRGQE